MKLYALGASREVGRSSFLLRTDKNLLLDYGVKIWTEQREPSYPHPFNFHVDAAIISHAHLDHSGFVPHLYTMGNIPWYATPPTRDICEILFQDSMKIMGDKLPYKPIHFKKAMKSWNPLFYGKPANFGKTRVNLRDAGHIAGASIVELDYNGKKFVYTGDYKSDETDMHKGAELPKEEADYLMIESTYAFRDHPERKELEKQLFEEIRETMDEGGHVLFPAFALGRSQELISILRGGIKDVPIFVDGMSKKINQIYSKYQFYLKDPENFLDVLSSVTPVTGPRTRKQAVSQPSLIVTTAGMMEGGPVLNYLFNVLPNSKVIFSGYNVEGTNGWRLLNHGKIIRDGYELDVDLPVEYLDFSAHAGRDELLAFIKKANPEKVILVHGDQTEKFAKELREMGFDAVAPQIGDSIELA
ncbi:MBL fold metallo-hydrolase [Candidatus Micrarchaeota archaeon]|nr:MBL fold metallo-hydrolase [Candidatus Micrarchaeota archaeon]